jgi:hypothetical protein
MSRTETGVQLRRQARALARIHAQRLLTVLQRDDDAAVLLALHELAAGAGVALGAYVAGLRDEEVPWSAVGDALGVTRQAAAQRFGSGRSGSIEDAPDEVAELLAREGYDDRVPPHKLAPGHVGRLAGYCYQRQHGRCPGHALGEPCACWCHETREGATPLLPPVTDAGRVPEWDELAPQMMSDHNRRNTP